MKKFVPVVLISLLIALLGNFAIAPAESASAANCRNHGGAQNSFHYSSQVDGAVFTLCGKTVASKIIKRVVAVKPSKVKQIVKPKPIAKPKVIAKTKPKTVVKKKIRRHHSNSSAAFSPRRPVASLENKDILQPAQPVEFTVDSELHYRANRVLGHNGRVRFTPIVFEWVFSDGGRATGRTVSHEFAEVGTYQAVARVTFAVSYRFDAQSGWTKDPGSIRLMSNRLEVRVGQGDQAGREIYLVNDPLGGFGNP